MFKPNGYYKHVKDIDYNKLKKQGIKLLAFDLDNTLDIPDIMTKDILPEVSSTLDTLEKEGFDIFIISNNKIQGRVESFAKLRKYEYLEWARKPFLGQYKKSEYINKYNKNEICFIGDKIVTDVIGGRRFGSHTILVDPLDDKTVHWYTKIMTFSENLFSKIIGFKRGNYYE